MFAPDFNLGKQNTLTDSWHLTINSNRTATSQEEAIKIRNELKAALEKIFDVFPKYLHAFLSRKAGGNKFNFPIDTPVDELIIPNSVKVIPKFEIGKYTHRIHSHTLVQFDTEDKYIYQIDTKGLNIWIHENIGPLYIHVRHIPNGIKNVLEYIMKDQYR